MKCDHGNTLEIVAHEPGNEALSDLPTIRWCRNCGSLQVQTGEGVRVWIHSSVYSKELPFEYVLERKVLRRRKDLEVGPA
jgi:hypothetical protein